MTFREISDASVSFGECEVCGEPATSIVQDFYKSENFASGTWDYSKINPAHLFCQEHYRPSEQFEVSSLASMFGTGKANDPG